MSTLLFHKDVWAPKAVFQSPGAVRVKYSRHAERAAADDRYGDLTRYLSGWVDLDSAEIVEVEVTDGAVSKRVARVPVTDELDLVMVIRDDGLVKTVWGNLHNDTHKTLDRSKFVRGPQDIH